MPPVLLDHRPVFPDPRQADSEGLVAVGGDLSVERLRERGFVLFDVQMVTAATAALGAREIDREDYLKRLAHATALPRQFAET